MYHDTRKITILALFAVVFSSVSLFVSYSSLDIKMNGNGVAQQVVNETNFHIDKVYGKEFFVEEDYFTKEPVILDNYTIDFGVNLNQVNSFANFYFDLSNTGTKDCIIKNIIIEGIEEYNNLVKVEIDGIQIGSYIPGNSNVNNVKVSVKYVNAKYDTEVEQNIVLDNLKIIIELM